MFITLFVVCCVGSGLSHKLIDLSEESCWCVCFTVCYLETPTVRWCRPDLGCCAPLPKEQLYLQS